jgi:hypothetical protein
MNNALKLLIITLAAAISLTGCESIENSSQADDAKIAAAKNKLAIPAETSRDLDLPAVLDGVAVRWASSDEAVISSDGLVRRRPLYDAAATLTATLTLGGASDTKEFAVTVSAIVFEEAEAELVEVNFDLIPYSNVQHAEVIMTYPDENVVFDCNADKGVLTANRTPMNDLKDTAKNVSILPGEYLWLNDVEKMKYIRWHNCEIGEDGSVHYLDLYPDYSDFIEIVLKREENIIGYAVVKVFYVQSDIAYNADLLKSVLFLQAGGEYQDVTEEYVKAAIEKVKTENKGEDSL